MKIRRLVSLMMALILAIALAVPASAAELTYDVPGGKLYFDAATGTITRSDDTITEADIPAEINGIPVTAIGSAAFAQRYDLTRVTIPDTVTTIGRSAFYGCRSLTGIVIPDSVTSIDQDAFRNCTGLTRATLGGGMRSVPRAMFYGCSSLTSITIPENITSIGYDAFSGSGLTSVAIPSSVTTISNSAFSSCRSLRSAYIPDSVTSIGNWALAYNDSLTDVRLSNSLTKIPDRLFESCDSLETCTIPNGVTYLGDAFRFCSGLKSVTIPATVTAIDSGTFYGCDSLTDVYYGSDAAHWSQVEVGGLNDGLDQATIHFSGPVAGFSDVTTGDYYADAVQWAVNHGVTGGTSATTFSPAAAVTRGQAVTFLWRAAAGQSAASSDWSAAAVSWAQESGLTDGLSFSAKADCPRSDVIYCLWKQMA